MQGDQHPTRVLLRQARERTLEALSEAFRKDEIGLDEFERRVDAAYAATTPADLNALLSDLSPIVHAGAALVSAPAVDVVEVVEVLERAPNALAVASRNTPRRTGPIAVFASVERRGRFVLEPSSRAVAVFGNLEIDLRDVVLPAGITELHVRAVLGNVEITVPPELAVECEGKALFGNFSGVSRVPPGEAEARPVLRVIGSALFGNVEIHTRPRGEGVGRLTGHGA